MVQQGQVFELKSKGAGTRWAYRYRVGGRGSRRRGVRKLGHRQGRLSRGCFVFVDEAAQQFVLADAPRGSPGGRRRGFVGRLKRE